MNLKNRCLASALAAFLVAPALSAQTAHELPRADAEILPGAVQLHSAKEYRKAARYPSHNQLVAVGAVDPVHDKGIAHKMFLRAEQDGPEVAVWTAKPAYRANEGIPFFAEAKGQKLVSVSGDIVNQNGEQVGYLSFLEGASGLEKAPAAWSANAVLNKSLPTPELAEAYLVKLQAVLEDGTTLYGSTGFLVSNPWAELTGEYRDQIVDGNLVVSAQVEVTREGRFHLAGSLAAGNEPFATSQTAVVLEPGLHWIDLDFYGLMFHDRQAKGALRLAVLQLRTTGGMPNALNDLVENVHVIKPLKSQALTRQAVYDRDLMDLADQLEGEAMEARDKAGLAAVSQ